MSMATLLFSAPGPDPRPTRGLQRMYRGENEPRIIDKMLTFGELWSLHEINGGGRGDLASQASMEQAIVKRVGSGGGNMIPITTRPWTAMGYGRTIRDGADGQLLRESGTPPLSPLTVCNYSIIASFLVREISCRPGNVIGEGEFLVPSRTQVWDITVWSLDNRPDHKAREAQRFVWNEDMEKRYSTGIGGNVGNNKFFT
jgi:hypothetical protein